MIRVGVIGLGTMGAQHIKNWAQLENVELAAVADKNPQALTGDFSGAWLDTGASFDPQKIITSTDFNEILDSVDVVDICTPTPFHSDIIKAALRAGKDILCEKPLARTSDEAAELVELIDQSNSIFMPAMCMRFWPTWRWLKEVIESNQFGKVLSATFRRWAGSPPGWFTNGELSGGGILDMHLHDSDFVYYLFGKPDAILARGHSTASQCIDFVQTSYLYNQGPAVTADGGWATDPGFDFAMKYTVNFEKAVADFDIRRQDQLLLYRDGKSQPIICIDSDGYLEEMKYFIECVQNRTKPTLVTARDGLESIKIVEAEVKSATTGDLIKL